MDNEFNHKIYELLRSHFFSPLKTLIKVNEVLTTEFVQEYDARISSDKKDIDYYEYCTFEQVKVPFH